jgi:hypothetical protein
MERGLVAASAAAVYFSTHQSTHATVSLSRHCPLSLPPSLPPISIALDAESEAGVQAGLRALVAGRTVLVIAHRLSTVKAASAGIAVLSDGRIGEFGGHGALAAAGGLYARLVAAQALMM